MLDDLIALLLGLEFLILTIYALLPKKQSRAVQKEQKKEKIKPEKKLEIPEPVRLYPEMFEYVDGVVRLRKK